MKVIIPAAGYAKRLGKIVENKPKHLLEVGGIPIIYHLILGIENLPIEDVYLVSNDKFYEQFLNWKNSIKTRLNIKLINDGTRSNEDRLGTVGDIWFAIDKFGINDDLFIIAGDNLYSDQTTRKYDLKGIYDAFLKLNRFSGIVGLYDVGDLDVARQMNSLTFFEDKIPSPGEYIQIKRLVEKDPNPISTIIAVMIEAYPRKIIDFFRKYIEKTDNHDRMGDFRAWLLNEGQIPIYGYLLNGKWFDIGLPEQLEEARRFYDNIKII